MVSKATGRFIRMSPQKARLVVDLIRGKDVNEALMTLKFTNKSATGEIEKVVRSAVANASNKSENVDVDKLFVETAYINEGPRQKRIRPAPMGRAYRYQRRSSHITIELGEFSPTRTFKGHTAGGGGLKDKAVSPGGAPAAAAPAAKS